MNIKIYMLLQILYITKWGDIKLKIWNTAE